MTYLLIFGESVEPGSRDSWSRILSMKTGGDVECFRKETEKLLAKPLLDSVTTQVVAELEKARDVCFKAGQFDEVWHKVWLIGEMTGTFSEENLEVALDALQRAGRLKHAMAVSYILKGSGHPNLREKIYEPGHLLGRRDEVNFYGGQTNYALMAPYFENFLLIDESISWIERFVLEAELHDAFKRIRRATRCGVANEDVFFEFLEGIGQNAFLTALFDASAKFVAMKTTERTFLLKFIDLLYGLQVYNEDDRLVVKLRRQKWFMRLVNNLGFALVGEPSVVNALAPYLFDQICHLLWTTDIDLPVTEQTCAFDCELSLPWLCDMSVLSGILEGKQFANWVYDGLEQPRPFAIAFDYLGGGGQLLRNKIEKMSSQECKIALEMQILLGAINFVEWKGALVVGVIPPDVSGCLRSAYTSRCLLQWILEGQRNFVIQVAESSKWELLRCHESYFMQLVFRLQFLANNVTRAWWPYFERQLGLIAACFDVFNSKAFSEVRHIAAIVEVKEFKEMFAAAVNKLLRHYKSTELSVLDSLLDVAALCCSASPGFRQCFTKESHDFAFQRLLLGQARKCSPQLVATLLRTADASLRQRWKQYFEKFGFVVVAYLRYFSDMNLLSKINTLLTVQAIVGQRPTPLVPLSHIFQILPQNSFTLVLDSFSGDLLNDGNGEESCFFNKIGVLVAGILLATLAAESRGTNYFNSVTKSKSVRKLLLSEMEKALHFFSCDTPPVPCDAF